MHFSGTFMSETPPGRRAKYIIKSDIVLCANVSPCRVRGGPARGPRGCLWPRPLYYNESGSVPGADIALSCTVELFHGKAHELFGKNANERDGGSFSTRAPRVMAPLFAWRIVRRLFTERKFLVISLIAPSSTIFIVSPPPLLLAPAKSIFGFRVTKKAKARLLIFFARTHLN